MRQKQVVFLSPLRKADFFWRDRKFFEFSFPNFHLELDLFQVRQPIHPESWLGWYEIHQLMQEGIHIDFWRWLDTLIKIDMLHEWVTFHGCSHLIPLHGQILVILEFHWRRDSLFSFECLKERPELRWFHSILWWTFEPRIFHCWN